jgi:murein DD-endopeptidase / murein LD-carboxypeptidase
MMGCRIILICVLCPFLMFSQTKKRKISTHGPKKDLHNYFESQQLCPDSASTPFLFYQVYDWAGTRYKYSGNTKKGIDCSGFVSKMYANTYCETLCGGSNDIWKTVRPVEKADLMEGDLLFFKIKKGQISHVGIYLGKNKFAHASVKHGVIISDLNEPYYQKYFFKGGRMPDLITIRN